MVNAIERFHFTGVDQLPDCIAYSVVFLQNWLQKYAWRITIGPDVFLIAAGAAVLITLLTVSMQAIKAALANPVKKPEE